MKMPDSWLGEETQALMTDPTTGLVAPVVVWGAVGALSGGSIPEDVSVRAGVGGGTTWQAIWVGRGAVGFVEARHSLESWGAYSKESTPETMTAWTRPIGRVSAVELLNVECEETTHTWRWKANAQVTFEDGTSVDLLPFGESVSDGVDQRLQRALDALAAALES